MIKIFTVLDILKVSKQKDLPLKLTEKLLNDQYIVKVWSDQDDEYSFHEFDASQMGYGYVCLFEGGETKQELQSIGLNDRYESIIPEEVKNYWIEGHKYTRIIVVCNNSFSLILWIKDTDVFDSYVYEDESKIGVIKPPF